MSEVLPVRRAGLQPHLALLAVQLMFGTWPIVGKIALRVLPSTGLVALRVAGAALAFGLLSRVTRHGSITRRADYLRLALYSLLGVVVNQLLFTKGLALSTVINATLLSTAIPVFTLLVGVVLGNERLSARTAAGMLLAAGGVVYLVDPFRADFSSATMLGNLLLVANTVAYGAYIALSQDVLRRYGALTVITWIFALGSLMVLPLGGFYLARTPLQELSAGVWLAVLYIILVPTVGAYYLNAWALARVSPGTVAVYVYLQPLIAAAFAPLVLGAAERRDARTWVAAGLIFAGVGLVSWGGAGGVMEEVSEHPEALGH